MILDQAETLCNAVDNFNILPINIIIFYPFCALLPGMLLALSLSISFSHSFFRLFSVRPHLLRLMPKQELAPAYQHVPTAIRTRTAGTI